jgi:hypothetical protein
MTDSSIGVAATAADTAPKPHFLGRLRGFRWTIGRRLILAMLVTVSLGVVALAAAMVNAQLDRAVDQAMQDSALSHRLMATEAAAAVHLHETAFMDRRLSTFIQTFENTLARLEAYDKDGKRIYTYTGAGLARPRRSLCRRPRAARRAGGKAGRCPARLRRGRRRREARHSRSGRGAGIGVGRSRDASAVPAEPRRRASPVRRHRGPVRHVDEPA